MLYLSILPEARLELLEHLAYIESSFGTSVMLDVSDSIDRQLYLLCREPYMGSRIPTKPENQRKFVLHRNLTVYYEFDGATLEVFAFWNNHRDPSQRPV